MHAAHAISQSQNCLYKYGEQIKGIRTMTWGTISGGPVNLCTWNMLYPYNYATNYGGQYQLNVMDMGRFSPQQAVDVRNIFNPFYQLMRFQVNLANAMNPAQNADTMLFAQSGYANGYQMMENVGVESSISSTANEISSLIAQLDQALASNKLTSAQKNQLRALKREAEALQDKIADIAALRQSGATNEQIKTAISQIRNEYRELRDRVQAAADQIRETIEDSEGSESGSTEGSGSSEDVGSGSGSGSDEVSSEILDDFQADGRHSSLGRAPSTADCRDWATRFYNATDNGWFGWTTDDEAFERCVKELDETNVVEMIKEYDKSKSDDDKFFMALGADAEHYQKRELYTHILNVLQTRAETLGLEDEIAEYVQGAVAELDDGNISKKIVSEKLNAIVVAIREAEARIANAKQGNEA